MTWRERTQAARERGEFIQEDVRDAESWATCAVGEQHAKMPDVIVYTNAIPDGPADRELGDLGIEFSDYVGENNPVSASQTLDAIEDRADALKRWLGETGRA